MRNCLLFIYTVFHFFNVQAQVKDSTQSIQFKILPIINKLQYVGDHPYEWNDGAMIPAKGWQQNIIVEDV